MSSFSPINADGKGRLIVYLGYAAGVGKTYHMLQEAQRLRREGVDIVVGYFEPHARPDTIAQLEGLEMAPRRVIEYRGTRFEEMDTDAILTRRPQSCVVDEFPHSNIPGSERPKRWEDVLILLDHGIDVLTTMNVQHLESLNDQIYEVAGVRVRETIPDWVLQQASEVIMIDLTPRALLNRLERGVVYKGDKAQRAKENFFREGTLVALRELALRQTAHEVEQRNTTNEPEPVQSVTDNPAAPALPASSGERVLVYITGDPTAALLIRRGKRVADYLHGDCLAVAVCPGRGLAELDPEKREALEKHLNFARKLHIDTHLLTGGEVPNQLVTFARRHKVTQIYLARPQAKPWDLPIKRDFVQRVARLARDMEVTIVAERKAKPSGAR